MKIVTKKFSKTWKTCCQIWQLFIKRRTRFSKFSFSTNNFYGLPKVHKSKIIQDAIQVQNSEYIKIYKPPDLTLRPIVADLNCPTRRLSNVVDILWKPFLFHIKNYIKDILIFLQNVLGETNGILF